MRSFEVRQNGRILFVIVARSLAAARRLVEARVIGPVVITAVRCRS
jgi:hypothetical protein